MEGGFLGEDDGLNPTIKYNFRTVEVKLAGSCFFFDFSPVRNEGIEYHGNIFPALVHGF